MHEEQSIRAALYTRVSTEEQAKEGFSLDAQMRRLVMYCEMEGWTVAGQYREEGHSGRNTEKRPEYQRMMEDRDQWDVVLVLKMDRIHRNTKEFIIMMEDLKKHGQEFVSTFDKFNTKTATGRFALDIIQRIAQLESEQIGERTYIGMREKAESGQGIMGFNPPFGYDIEEGKIIVNDDEFDTAREIFSLYLSGMTLDDIAYNLNREERLTRKGNPWNKYNLRNILHNPFYAGFMRWEDTRQRHDAEPVISIEDYNKVQMMMASNTRDPKKRNPKLLKVQ